MVVEVVVEVVVVVEDVDVVELVELLMGKVVMVGSWVVTSVDHSSSVVPAGVEEVVVEAAVEVVLVVEEGVVVEEDAGAGLVRSEALTRWGCILYNPCGSRVLLEGVVLLEEEEDGRVVVEGEVVVGGVVGAEVDRGVLEACPVTGIGGGGLFRFAGLKCGLAE